eukprot:scaffold2754_cov37-Attheya_sp.AAC.1
MTPTPTSEPVVMNLPILPPSPQPQAVTGVDSIVQPGAQSIAELVITLLGADPPTQGAGGGSHHGGRSLHTTADP